MSDGNDKDLGQLLKRVNAGSDPAAQELYDLFSATILQAVRRHLPRALRPKFDSLDFAQEAWAEFWASAREKYSFHDSDQFAAFLTRMAENIVADAVRQRLLGKKYNVNREVPFQTASVAQPREVPDRQPTPSQVVMRDEEWRHFLAKQPPVYQQVFILYREGKKPADIAEATGISRRNVDRILARVLQGPKTGAQS